MKIIQREASNTLQRVSIWHVISAAGHPFTITVDKPAGEAPEGGWPAIMATDGNTAVGSLYIGAYYMGMSMQIPQSVVVTIGYPFDHDPPHMVARNRDLTPSAWPEWDESYGAILGLKCPPSGEAAAFLNFVNGEVKPAIEAELSVNPAEWTMVGHSLGGLFTTYALLTDPGQYRRYLAYGASYWWQSPLLFDMAEKFAALTSPIDVTVYLAAGDQETSKKVFESVGEAVKLPMWVDYLRIMKGTPDIVEDTIKMADILRRRNGVTARAHILENETHASAALTAISQGLRWLHNPIG